MRSFLFVIISIVFTGNFTAQEIKGVVKDTKTQAGIPYVNMGIPAKAFGFNTNENGEFSFRLTGEQETDTVQITCIGYYPAVISIGDLRKKCESTTPILLQEAVYELATTVVRPNEYETKVLGNKSVADLECVNFSGLRQKDTASIRRYKEKGISDKAAGIEIGNKIRINKGQQTFIDRIQFKTCTSEGDTAIYRINIYSEGKTVKRMITPVGIVKIVSSKNELKEPIIVKTIGKTEVHDIDVSKQNIQVTDDFMIALECIYSSKSEMNVGAKPSMFGSTDLLIRESTMDEWIKVPLVELTFISATVTYRKKGKK
jgi:hypothetical protein